MKDPLSFIVESVSRQAEVDRQNKRRQLQGKPPLSQEEQDRLLGLKNLKKAAVIEVEESFDKDNLKIYNGGMAYDLYSKKFICGYNINCKPFEIDYEEWNEFEMESVLIGFASEHGYDYFYKQIYCGFDKTMIRPEDIQHPSIPTSYYKKIKEPYFPYIKKFFEIRQMLKPSAISYKES
jgi:hypothetical protein